MVTMRREVKKVKAGHYLCESFVITLEETKPYWAYKIIKRWFVRDKNGMKVRCADGYKTLHAAVDHVGTIIDNPDSFSYITI